MSDVRIRDLIDSLLLDISTGQERLTVQRDPTEEELDDLWIAMTEAIDQGSTSWRLREARFRIGQTWRSAETLFAASALSGRHWAESPEGFWFKQSSLSYTRQMSNRYETRSIHLNVFPEGDALQSTVFALTPAADLEVVNYQNWTSASGLLDSLTRWRGFSDDVDVVIDGPVGLTISGRSWRRWPTSWWLGEIRNMTDEEREDLLRWE